jgi:glutamyl/glutaminyl-tRNA synthetase
VLFEKAGFDVSDSEKTKKIILGIYKKVSTGEDVTREARIFYLDEIEITEEDALEFLKKEASRSVLEMFLKSLDAVDKLDMESFKKVMADVQDQTGITKQDLWMPIRIALTGVTHGADLPLVIEIFGKKKAKDFVRQVLLKYF